MVQIRSDQMPAPFLLDLELTHFGPNLIHKSYVTRLKSEPERPDAIRCVGYTTHTQKNGRHDHLHDDPSRLREGARQGFQQGAPRDRARRANRRVLGHRTGFLRLFPFGGERGRRG